MRERKIEYERLEHTADEGFLVKAPSLERLYINAALALTDMMVKLESIMEKERQSIQIQADDRDTLMVRWLNEILFLFEQRKFLCHKIVFDRFDGRNISATLWGESYDPSRHGSISEIKAVTYHQLELTDVAQPEPHFCARIFLDL